MSTSMGSSFPIDASIGDEHYDPIQKIKYRFQGGGDPASVLNWIIIEGTVETDPDTTGWGEKQNGANWFNTTEQQWKGFNGTNIVIR